MIWILVTFVAVMLLLIVGLPFFQSRASDLYDPEDRPAHRQRNLREEKAKWLLALRELDFDFEMGKLSPEDYKQLKEKYEGSAVSVLKELERLENIWTQIQKELGSQITVESPSNCASCKRSLAKTDRFCGHCGSPNEQIISSTAAVLLFLLVLLIAGFSGSKTHAAQLNGTVMEIKKSGTVPVASERVQLMIYRDDKEIAGAETKTNGKGQFVFQDLELSKPFRYVAVVTKEGVPFSTTSTAPHATSLPPILLRPISGVPSMITARDVVILEFPQSDLIKIHHSITLANQGDVLYDPRSKGGQAIDVGLLPGAFGFQLTVEPSDNSIQMDPAGKNLQLRTTIFPGPLEEKKLEFFYYLQPQSRSLSFAFPLSLRRDKFSLVLSDKNLPVTKTTLRKDPTRSLNGKTYYLYSGGPFTAIDVLAFTLSNIPNTKYHWRVALVSMLGFTGLMGLFLLAKPASKVRSHEERKQLYLNDLKILESEFRAGNISSQHYHVRRDRLRDLLLDLVA